MSREQTDVRFPTNLQRPQTGEQKHSKQWWCEFIYAGQRIRESAKTTRKTVAMEAERKRRLECERGYNDVSTKKVDRIRSISNLADAFVEDYKVRHPRSATFAEFATGHLKRILGGRMAIDVSAAAVKEYQTARLKEKAAPKSINEEVGFLLRILEEQGDMIRAKLRREKSLKLRVKNQVAKAWSPEEKQKLLEAAKAPPCHHTSTRRSRWR